MHVHVCVHTMSSGAPAGPVPELDHDAWHESEFDSRQFVLHGPRSQLHSSVVATSKEVCACVT